MTPLPKRRHSSQRSGKRKRAHLISVPTLTKCPNCGQLVKPHTVCPNCGYYDKRLVVSPKPKKEKRNE